MPTSLTDLIVIVIVGLIAGILAIAFNSRQRRHRIDMLEALIVGVFGAIFGRWLFSLIGLADTNILGTLIVAFVGANVVLYVVRKLRRR